MAGIIPATVVLALQILVWLPPLSAQTGADNQIPFFPASETGMRTIPENTTPGVVVGDPVAAEDTDSLSLVYSLGGPGSAVFAIDSTTGQIRTWAALNHESQASHSLTVIVNDGQAEAELDVSIAITNVDEPGILSFSPETPRVGEVFRAHIADPDGWVNVTSSTWQVQTPVAGDQLLTVRPRTINSWIPSSADSGGQLRVELYYHDGYVPIGRLPSLFPIRSPRPESDCHWRSRSI